MELPRGILKIKKGYNPNSSSIGSVVYSFPFAAIAISAIVSVISILIKNKKKSK